MSSEPILIIGAGLGGLALAQSLQQKKIPYRIFERDLQNGMRQQGWAISLHPWLMSDICSAIRDDEAGLRAIAPTATLGLHSEGVIYSFENKERKQLFKFGEGTEQPFVRVDRAKFRDWLLQGLSVEWGSKFTEYEERSDYVVARFEDGTEVRGSLIVGADGISSRVRRQVLHNNNEPQRLPIGIIVGEVEASFEQYQRWLKLATSFSVGFAGTRRLFVGLKSVADDRKTAKFYWMFGWADNRAADSCYWTDNATQSEMHTFVMENLHDIEEEYIEPFLATPVEGILQPPLQMRDMVPPSIPKGRVTLLGDAIHPMVPFRGEGANMAIKDAVVLADMVTQRCDLQNLADQMKLYEAEMSERSERSVIRSRESTFMSQTIFRK